MPFSPADIPGEAWTAGVAGVFSLGVAWLSKARSSKDSGRIRDLENELAQAEREMVSKSKAMSMPRYTSAWETIRSEVTKLIDETEIDRFLILVAWNGKRDPKWVTATVQIREEGKPIEQYIDVEVDDYYRSLMLKAKDRGPTAFSVSALPDCLIKSIYESEGVEQSVWDHISSHDMPDGTREVDFCSYSSSRRGPLSPGTIIRCKLITDRLKAISAGSRF